MATLKKLAETYALIEKKQTLSDFIGELIKDINEATDPDGDVELEITRSKRIFTLPANGLLTSLNTKKDNLDQAITTLLAKVTIT